MSLIADIVVSSATVAFAHFGLTVDVPDREPPKVERSVARTPVKKADPIAARDTDCPEQQAANLHRI